MSAELYWLTLTALMTSMFWLPYLIDRVNVRGVMGAFGNPGPDAPDANQNRPQIIFPQHPNRATEDKS